MKAYLDLLDKVLTKGKSKDGRNGGTLSLSGERIEVMLFDSEITLDVRKLGGGFDSIGIKRRWFNPVFPLLTTKKVHFKSIVWELLWFLSGSTNIKMLQDNGVTIWDEWADENGEVGYIYGAQWRRWQDNNFYDNDQIVNCINLLKNDPYSRRNVVSAWNAGELDEMALPPCHFAFQMVVEPSDIEGEKDYLSCIVTMRSCDLFLGSSFNIASYALLTYMLAKECNLQAYKVVINFSDLHLYKNHIEQAKLQLTRKPMPLPQLDLTNFDLMKVLSLKENDTEAWREQFNCIKLLNYESHPAIKAPISK